MAAPLPMIVAVSGAHRTGKTTLVTELSTRLPHYQCVDEPYHLMEDEGFVFAHPPSLEDFVAQLERSLEVLAEAGRDVLLDRCPVDLLAYILGHSDRDAFDLDRWLPHIEATMTRLDLVVLVPLQSTDRELDLPAEDENARREVDQLLHELLVDDSLNLDLPVLRVPGDLRGRADATMRRLETLSAGGGR